MLRGYRHRGTTAHANGLANPQREFYHEDKRVALYRATGEIGTPRPYAAPDFDVPTIHVSTENDYSPNLDDIVQRIQSQNVQQIRKN